MKNDKVSKVTGEAGSRVIKCPDIHVPAQHNRILRITKRFLKTSGLRPIKQDQPPGEQRLPD